MSRSTRTRLQAAMVAMAPAVLLIALLYHPHLPGWLPNEEAVASAVIADPGRWAVAHLGAALASGLIAVAFLAVRSHLRTRGEDRWSAWGLPFIVLGSTLYAVLPGMEFAPLAAEATGADVVAAQAALGPWFLPILLTAAVIFAVGALGFAVGVTRSGVLAPGPTLLVTAGLGVMAASRFVPLAVVQFHVQGLATIAALWPLAYVMWRWRPPQAHPVEPTRQASTL